MAVAKPTKSTKPTTRQKVFTFSILLLIANFALIVALYGIPVLTEASGLAREHVTYGIAAICFVVAIVATRWAKSLNKKNVGVKRNG